jgi:hypothetical protein
MEKNPPSSHPVLTRILVAAAFLIMVALNGLANALPINGQTTGAISDNYFNLFAPAGLTFAIWGLIYLLLAFYTIAQFGLLARQKDETARESLNKVGVYFILSSLANTLWILAWHFEIMTVAMVLMLIILVCLIIIVQEIRQDSVRMPLAWRDKFLLRLPFSVYFGWITVATIANATTLLVYWKWDGFGLAAPAWTVIALLAGLVIGLTAMLRNQDIAYGLVLVWAYAGILIKHTSPAPGHASQYPLVIGASAACIVLFLAAEIYLLLALRRKA